MTMVCFVFLADQAPLNRLALEPSLEGNLPHQTGVASIEEKGGGIHQIDLDGSDPNGKSAGSIFISEMPAMGIDAEEESPGLLWPDAPQQLAGHQSHWILTTATSEFSPVDEALLLTRVVEGILRTHPSAIGVLWHQHGLKISSENFVNLLDALEPGELPVSLWVDITVIPAEDAPVIAMTTGMDNFDLMEIENVGSPEPPDELYARIMGVCEYLLQHGPILKHGDTLGETENEKIQVLHADSMFGRDDKVIHLRYDSGDTGGSPAIPGQPNLNGQQASGLQALGMLAACLLVIGLLIFGTFKGVVWVTAQIAGEPEVPAIPWQNNAAAENKPRRNATTVTDRATNDVDSASDSVERDPTNTPTPTVESPSRQSQDTTEDAGLAKPGSESPKRTLGNGNPFQVEPGSSATNAPTTTPTEPNRNASNSDAVTSPPKTAASQTSSNSGREAPRNPFQVDPSVTPTNQNPFEAQQEPENPFEVDPDPNNPFRVDPANNNPGESPVSERSASGAPPTEGPAEENPFQVDPTAEKLPKIGDKVRVKWGSRWWDGKIIAIEGDRFKFSYDGWSSNWDEWKTVADLRWPDDTPVASGP